MERCLLKNVKEGRYEASLRKVVYIYSRDGKMSSGFVYLPTRWLKEKNLPATVIMIQLDDGTLMIKPCLRLERGASSSQPKPEDSGDEVTTSSVPPSPPKAAQP